MGGAQRFLYNLISRISNHYEILVATGSPRRNHTKAGSDGGNELADKFKLLNTETVKLEKLKREISPISDIKACFEIKKLIETFKPDTLFLLSSKAGFIGSLATRYLPHTIRPRVIYRIGGWTFNDPWPK